MPATNASPAATAATATPAPTATVNATAYVVPDVVRHESGGWTFTCGICGFVSKGWQSRDLARERKSQHYAEHDGARPARPPANDREG